MPTPNDKLHIISEQGDLIVSCRQAYLEEHDAPNRRPTPPPAARDQQSLDYIATVYEADSEEPSSRSSKASRGTVAKRAASSEMP